MTPALLPLCRSLGVVALAASLFSWSGSTASAQFSPGYGGFAPGYGAYGGFGPGYGFGGPGLGAYGPGLGGYGPGYGVGGSYGFGAIGYPFGAYAGYSGVPFQASINAYNLGYGNTVGVGLVPPAYVGTGTAGIGPVGIGGTNPLFGLGLSPLAVNNAIAEQALRRGAGIATSAPANPVVRYRFATPTATQLVPAPGLAPTAPR